jgi:hypothetical protein
MEPELKQLLEENLRISKENNVLLLKVRSVQRWAQITRYLYWVAIVLVSFGAFYFIKPYLGNVLNLYTGGVTSNVNNVNDLKNSLMDSQKNIQNLLNNQ